MISWTKSLYYLVTQLSSGTRRKIIVVHAPVSEDDMKYLGEFSELPRVHFLPK